MNSNIISRASGSLLTLCLRLAPNKTHRVTKAFANPVTVVKKVPSQTIGAPIGAYCRGPEEDDLEFIRR